MDAKRDGVETVCLPQSAVCTISGQKHPSDIEECPLGQEECDGDCFYYREE